MNRRKILGEKRGGYIELRELVQEWINQEDEKFTSPDFLEAEHYYERFHEPSNRVA